MAIAECNYHRGSTVLFGGVQALHIWRVLVYVRMYTRKYTPYLLLLHCLAFFQTPPKSSLSYPGPVFNHTILTYDPSTTHPHAFAHIRST